MDLIISRVFEIVPFLIWTLLWFLGGYLVVINSFKISKSEVTIIGFGIGLVIQVWLSNWLGQILQPLLAFWLSALATFTIGILLTLFLKNKSRAVNSFVFPLKYWLPFLIIGVIFFMIGSGLAIFDDYQNLPVTSYIATGAIPPKFVLNPDISFDYHYLMLLNSAQWMRIADLFPWTALDLNRALFLSLSLILTAIFGYRLTKNRVAGWLTAIFFAFAGGIRWVLLFFPTEVLEKISPHITMIGSGKVTAEVLSDAMIKNWAIEGGRPFPFPFAFGNGFHNIPVFKHDGTGMMGTVIALLVILLFEHRKNISGKIVLTILLSAMALIDEIWFVFFITAAILFLILKHFQLKRLPDRETLIEILLIIVLPIVFSIFQGGVLTGVSKGLLQVISGNGFAASSQYYSINFPIRWPPAIISAHLGVLSLVNWAQLIVAICEVGPVFLMVPLFVSFGVKSFRSKRTIYSILAIGVVLSLLMIFVEYQGSAGISASKRLNLFAFDLLNLFTVPLLWFWLSKKKIQIKMIFSGIVFLTMVGGMVYFFISSIAIQRPVLSYYIDLMDASVQNLYWNTLDENAMVFDFDPSRSATIFARPLKSSNSWYELKPEYRQLMRNPDPYVLNEAGYTHFYLTGSGYESLLQRSRNLLSDSCINMVYEKEDWKGDFRWLMDISACKK